MLKRIKFDIRSWLSAGIYVLILLVIMPYAIWKGCSDERKIEQRGKKIKARIINIKGLKGNSLEIQYTIENKKFLKTISVPSNHNKNVGEDIFIIYDTLEFKNIKYYED
jgi:hypothetical protein